MILKIVENSITYLIRYLNTKFIHILLSMSSKKIKFPHNTKIQSFKSIKTTNGGSISIGTNCFIDKDVLLYAKKGKITIGNNVYIGKGTFIISQDFIEIGNDCQIAAYCDIRDSNHGIKKNKLIRNQQDTIDKINIGNDVWIGSHVSITSGSIINNGAVIGTHSVVTKEIDKYAIAVGVPAKVINYRE